MTQRSEEAGPPQRGTREWYLYKRRMRLQGRSGGRLARFREISKRKQLSIEETVAGSLEPVFVSAVAITVRDPPCSARRAV